MSIECRSCTDASAAQALQHQHGAVLVDAHGLGVRHVLDALGRLADQAEDTSEWLAAHGDVLVIAPDYSTGLTHAELDRVDAWLADDAA